MVELDAIDTFFSAFPGFAYNRQNSSPKEFYRMCDEFGWSKNADGSVPPEREQTWKDFRVAMVNTFNTVFGTDANDPAAWERICVYLGTNPLPEGLESLRQVWLQSQCVFIGSQIDHYQHVVRTHVNLADMLDCNRVDESVRTFATEDELREYTIHEGRYFPKEDAYAGGLLKYLLREIHNQYHGKRGGRRKKDRKSNKKGSGSMKSF